MAEIYYTVQVKRNGSIYIIDSCELVPGDVYLLEEMVPCDSIVVSGHLFVNEVALTGENVPISKMEIGRVE